MAESREEKPLPVGKGGRPPKIVPGIHASFDDVIRALVKPVRPPGDKR